VLAFACFGRLAYGTTFHFVQKFHYLGNFLKKCFVAYSQINQNTLKKIIMFLHIVQASSQGIKRFLINFCFCSWSMVAKHG
jgi:hypothetical protein